MKSIGTLIKEARTRKNYSRAKLQAKTKIKKEFIEAIENEQWDNLPEYPVVQGFVRNIANALKISSQATVATLRRDYPPKKLKVNPNPDVQPRFVWSPRITFLAGVALAVLAVIIYLGIQYKSFVSPPELVVDRPIDGQVIDQGRLLVSGTTDPDATVKVNNQQVLIEQDGQWSTEIDISEKTTEIEVHAQSRAGKETIVRRTIVPQLES